jgi:hypothetical protein
MTSLPQVPACHDWTGPPAPRPGTGALRAIRAWQDGRCAICGLRAELVIDHHHASGLVRGLLCTGCNTAEGRHRGYYDEPYSAYRRRPPALIVGLTERYPHWRPDRWYYALGDPPESPALAARVLDHLIRHPPRRPGRPVEIPGLPGHFHVGDEMGRIAARLQAGG